MRGRRKVASGQRRTARRGAQGRPARSPLARREAARILGYRLVRSRREEPVSGIEPEPPRLQGGCSSNRATRAGGALHRRACDSRRESLCPLSSLRKCILFVFFDTRCSPWRRAVRAESTCVCRLSFASSFSKFLSKRVLRSRARVRDRTGSSCLRIRCSSNRATRASACGAHRTSGEEERAPAQAAIRSCSSE